MPRVQTHDTTLREGTRRANVGELLVAAVLLAGAVWAVYGRSLDVPLIFDDRVAITRNTSIQQLWPLVGDAERPGPLRPPHHTPVAGRPLVNLSFALNYHYGELDPRGYHVANILLHVLTALLVFSLVRRTLRLPYFQGRFDRAAGPLALAVALLWALHPLQTESVIYATQRTELMVTLFYLATLYSSLSYWQADTQGRRTAWLVAATLVSLAGMATKEIMVSAPVVVLLYERAFLAGSFREAWRRSWPLYVSLATTWIALVALNAGGPRNESAGFHFGVPVLNWWYTQSMVLWMYLKLVVWPSPLAVHYDMPLETLYTAWPWVLGVAALVAGTLVLLWRNHPVGFLGAWMAAILAPTFVVPIVTEMAAERRMYLPLAMLTALVVVGGYWLLRRASPQSGNEEGTTPTRPWLIAAASGVAIALMLVGGVVSARRLAIYEDPIALWEDTIASQPFDSMAHYNLGYALADQDRIPEAIAHYRRAIQLKPNYGNAYVNLGNLLLHAGQMQEAADQYQKALEVRPHDNRARFNLGAALAGAGRRTEAILQYQRALEVEPDAADIHVELGNVLADDGRDSEAMEHFQHAIELKPDDANVNYRYGSALLKMGRVDEAIGRFHRALEVDPDYVNVHNSLANALASAGRTDEAIEHARRVVELQPDSAKAHSNLGTQLLSAGRIAETIPEFQAALELAPNLAGVRNDLAAALASVGRIDEAIEHAQRVVELEPDNASAHGNLGTMLQGAGRNAEAIPEFRKALELNPDLGEVRVSLAEALRYSGQFEEAINLYQEALQLEPENLDALGGLAETYLVTNQPDQAVSLSQEAIRVARSQGQTELADRIEAWLRSFQANRAQSENASPATDEAP